MFNIILILKGFIVGVAFIIPGVSGGTLAVYLGVYKKFLDSVGNLLTDFKNSIKFLIPFFLGASISVLSLAKLFAILIEWNSFIVLMFFIGLLAGGIKHLYLKAKLKKFNISAIIALVVAFGLLITIIIIDKTNTPNVIATFDLNLSSYLLIVGLGIISVTTMIVPGISGSAMLMVLGYYTAIVSNVIGNITDLSNFAYNFQVLIFYVIGMVIGIFVFSKLISYLLEKYPKQTYFAILGFVLASMIGVFLEIRNPVTSSNYEEQVPIYKNILDYFQNNILVVLVGVILFVIGFVTTKYLTKLEYRREIKNG
ncbi:MAG: DUF368 domain-containing protein [Candidatus Izimaplasma sp.]|nr:DUF368 domain-containing protein [Candidatus Izimaplasma bacterium]